MAGNSAAHPPPELGVGRTHFKLYPENPATICRVISGMISFSSVRVVQITSANFPPFANSIKAASCRAALMSPAFHQSVAVAGRAAPMNSHA